MPTHRRAILEVRWGPLAYRKAILEPGQTLCFGGNDRSDFVIPNDTQLSPRHFSLSWDGERCHLRDLDSAKGTLLQGQRVAEGQVTNGAWIRAGDTNLMVYFEAHTPGTVSSELAEEKAAALHELGRQPNLFAIVDASRGTRPLQLLRESVDEHRSLYDGVRGDALAHVAPYLVALRPDSGLLERLVQEGWGARWGIYLTCPRQLKEVRRHLRRFLMVEDDDTGDKYYFRFYDPRTLRSFVPSCTPRQRQDFFGEVRSYLGEGERGELCCFTPELGAP